MNTAVIHDTRHKRQSLRDWETRRDSCNHLGDLTQFDQLGRRNSGRLAPVGDQDICGSCWAFAAAHAVTDTRTCSPFNTLPDVAPQQIRMGMVAVEVIL